MLAPFLFIVVLDFVLRKALEGKEDRLGLTLQPRQSRRIGPQTITDLNFADDIALLGDSSQRCRGITTSSRDTALKVGLGMNAKKTKAMVFN